jgi:hypothetical protein
MRLLLMRNCLDSMAPNDEELLRYALDEEPLRMGAKEHLEQCSSCQERLAAYKQTHAFLLSRLYRSQCPTATQLNHYCINMLPTDDMFVITDHIKICPLCAAEVLDIRHYLADFDLFPTPVLSSSPVRTVKQMLALLVPWHPQMVTRGLLPEAQDSSWPRQYRAGPLNISLHLSRNSSGEMILLGLFSSVNEDESVEGLEGAPVELHTISTPSSAEQDGARQETLLMCSSIDDLGNIVFKSVPVGEYVLIVHMADSELVIRGLTIERS